MNKLPDMGQPWDDNVRKTMLVELDENICKVRDRCGILSDLIDSLETAMTGGGGVRPEGSEKMPAPARNLQSLIGKSEDNAEILTALTIRLDNLINRL